ncbi:MAG: hypothetical protein IKP00_10600 [Victivallales bacterium]|nr:hypothetical protein [Victivallales bacterium]
MGFASPLSRLRFTHGYTLTAAYAASLLRGYVPATRLRSCHGYVPAAVVAALLCW